MIAVNVAADVDGVVTRTMLEGVHVVQSVGVVACLAGVGVSVYGNVRACECVHVRRPRQQLLQQTGQRIRTSEAESWGLALPFSPSDVVPQTAVQPTYVPQLIVP